MDIECVLCKDEIENPVALPCAHVYCHSCTYNDEGVLRFERCPLCNRNINEVVSTREPSTLDLASA
jgi:hypothetical protein